MSSINARASKISALSKNIEYTASKVPESSEKFEDAFKSASPGSKDFSNQFIIDVLPNFIPILCFIFYHVNKYCAFIEVSNHAKISPATFTAYCLAIIYSYFLASDLYIRPSASPHAAIYEEDQARKTFIEFMLTCPVPDFLEPLIKQFAPTTDETRPNVFFIPSAAGFSYLHHFGRIFPLIMFTHIHDCTAEMPSNSNRLAILNDLIGRICYTITDLTGNIAKFDASIANFFGIGHTNAAAGVYFNSRLYQIFSSVFNPVLFRDYQRRHTLASISITPVTYQETDINAYDFLFSASRANLAEFRVIFQSIASAMKGNIKCNGDLASYFNNISGQNICTHGYSIYSLPTFHHVDLFDANHALNHQLTGLTANTPTQIAAHLRYLQAPTVTGNTTLVQPAGVCQTDNAHPVTVTFDSVFNRLNWNDPANANLLHPRTNVFETFSEDRHLYPQVLVMNPFDPTTVDAWKATAFGMVIEHFELDGTVIPVPNIHISNGIENTWFADSAVPLHLCFRATSFPARQATTVANPRYRVQPPRQTRFAAASLLVDRTRVNLSRFNNQNNVRAAANANGYFPGLTFVNRVTWASKLQSFFGFRTNDSRDNGNANDTPPGMQNGQLLVWSPYTYVGFTDEDNFAPTFSESNIYFLTNLRTLFGTRIPLVKTNNAMESMPVA